MGPRIKSLLPILFGLILCASACESPTVTELGTPVTVGGVEFDVQGYDIRYLELSESGNTFEYARPVLTVTAKIANVGEGPISYSPTHSTQNMSEAQTPLLYLDPGPEADLPPESKTPINGVYLAKGALPEQVTETKTLQPGESLTDVFLYTVPSEEISSLIFSLPPSMHRGTMPVLFRIPYEPKQPKGPEIHEIGEPVAFDAAEFTVTGTDVAYVKTSDSAQGEGYSSEPLLKVSYAIENVGNEDFAYDPAHRDLSGRGPGLFAADKTFKRVKFPSTTSVEGQVQGTTTVAPGKKIEDFALFELPPAGVSALTFEYPARLFGGEGIARVNLPYEREEVKKPEELRKGAKDEGKKSDEG